MVSREVVWKLSDPQIGTYFYYFAVVGSWQFVFCFSCPRAMILCHQSWKHGPLPSCSFCCSPPCVFSIDFKIPSLLNSLSAFSSQLLFVGVSLSGVASCHFAFPFSSFCIGMQSVTCNFLVLLILLARLSTIFGAHDEGWWSTRFDV